ncbi:unnamed protein product [Alopecurus aequalis]
MPFSGPQPPQLGNLSNLEYLSLSSSPSPDTSMHSTYSTDVSWLARLPLLVHLDMSSVNLSTVADWPLVVNMIPSLELLYLPGCSLPGANHSLRHLNLTNLHYLDLSSNQFDHPLATSWFWNVTTIKHLGLCDTYLYGPFPDALGSMTALQELDFSDNGNAATIAADLKNLCELELLCLDRSLSSGNITEFLENLPACTSNRLLELRVSDNFMAGKLPNNMSHLTSLSSLSLSNNNITGAIPAGIGDCTDLKNLDLSSNHLTGAIPQGIENCTSLVHLDLSYNLLNGTIPPGVGNCTHLDDLVLSNNHLTGQVPSKISALSNLTILDMSYNNLDGVITEEYFVSDLESLKHIDLSHNSLSGPLPSEYRAGGLLALILSSNNFTGHIPESICGLQILIVLDLSNNLLEGELPRCSRMPNMIFLLLSNNNLSGEFPSSLGAYPSLVFLDLSWNSFSGALPLWIGDLVFLRVLQLSHNMFYGDIPVTVTNLNLLCHLNLAGNRISGAIPRSLSNITAMSQKCSSKPGVDMLVWYTGPEGKFREVWTVVMKRQELEYGAGIFEVLYIDLSLNHLTGGIPDEITSLYGLVNLNLSWNRLSGSIPAKIGDINSLESLDLSRNNLSGEIPPSISDLTYLSSLDLSYNSLTGPVPTGRQLDTLYSENPSMYSGNIGLCGSPLLRTCSGNYVAQHGDRQRSRENVYDPATFFYFGLTSGFMAGLWVVFCALLFKRAWRDAYFRVLDRLYGGACEYMIVTTCGRINRNAIAS